MSCVCGLTPLSGDTICPACASDITKLLAETDGVVDELVRAVPRASLTASYGERVSASGSLHAPLPINDGALDAHMALDKWLMGRALELAKVTRVPLTGRDSKGLSSYLMAHMNVLRRLDWAGAVRGELEGLLTTCENVTRKAEQKVFGGTCPEDGTNLYARKGSDIARCGTCSATYGLGAWQALAKTAKEYHIGTPAELSRALSSPAYGIEVSSDLIWRWARRGKIERANEQADHNGEPLKPTYRLRDVLDLNAKRKPLDGTAA